MPSTSSSAAPAGPPDQRIATFRPHRSSRAAGRAITPSAPCPPVPAADRSASAPAPGRWCLPRSARGGSQPAAAAMDLLSLLPAQLCACLVTAAADCNHIPLARLQGVIPASPAQSGVLRPVRAVRPAPGLIDSRAVDALEERLRREGWSLHQRLEVAPQHAEAGVSASTLAALAKLADRSGDQRMAAAAMRAVAYERSVFDPQRGNWLVSEAATTPTPSW